MKKLESYELIQEIASGGMATVYLARTVEGKLVAIKSCHPHLRRDPAFVTMFLDEARLAAQIRHPHVVRTYDVSDSSGLFFVMEYVDGANLAEALAWLNSRGERLPVELGLRILSDALTGLHAAHELRDESGSSLGLVHRDVSPQNLLIGIDGVTKITDFGVAKAEHRATRTRSGQVKGKTGYMAPEQILGERIDRRVDVYAAGVVLWEMLTGQRLFEGESDAAIINRVLQANIAPPSSVSGTPVALDAIVKKALAYEATDRYPTALAFAEALATSAVPIAPVKHLAEAIQRLVRDLPRPPLPPDSRRLERLRRLTASAIAVSLLVLIGAGYWALRLRPVARLSTPQSPSPLATTAVFRPATPATTVEPNDPPRPLPSTLPLARPLERKVGSGLPAAAAKTGESPPPRPKARPSEYRPNDL